MSEASFLGHVVKTIIHPNLELRRWRCSPLPLTARNGRWRCFERAERCVKRQFKRY